MSDHASVVVRASAAAAAAAYDALLISTTQCNAALPLTTRSAGDPLARSQHAEPINLARPASDTTGRELQRRQIAVRVRM